MGTRSPPGVWGCWAAAAHHPLPILVATPSVPGVTFLGLLAQRGVLWASHSVSLPGGWHKCVFAAALHRTHV